MIVGNGLSLSLREHNNPTLRPWHPSHPLGWTIPTPGKPSEPLLTNLPVFADAIRTIRSTLPGASDFELFAELYRQAIAKAGAASGSPTAGRLPLDERIVEARHYLANAYVRFQLAAQGGDSSRWAWLSWLRSYGKHVSNVASFNYDMVLEEALRSARVRHHTYLPNDRNSGTHVFKPHGSIDFLVGGIAATDRDGGKPLPAEYPLQLYVESPDVTWEMLRRISLDEALQPRLVLPIVLPAEPSAYRQLQWVRRCRAAWRGAAGRATHLVIVGISYWDCDRAEIDELVEAVPSGARAILADPQPSAALLSKLEDRFGTINVWTDGAPHALP